MARCARSSSPLDFTLLATPAAAESEGVVCEDVGVCVSDHVLFREAPHAYEPIPCIAHAA